MSKPITDKESILYDPILADLLSAMDDCSRTTLVVRGKEEIDLTELLRGEKAFQTIIQQSVIIVAHKGTAAECHLIAKLLAPIFVDKAKFVKDFENDE